MKVVMRTRTASEFDWEQKAIELNRLPCVGEYIGVPSASGGETSRHEIRLIVHLIADGQAEAEVYCNRVGPTQMRNIVWGSTLAPKTTDRPVLTVAEAAKEAQVSADTIVRRIVEGRLVAENWGSAKRKKWRIRPEALAAMKSPSESDPAPAPEPVPPPSRRGRRPRLATSSDSSHLPDASVLAKVFSSPQSRSS